MIKKNFAVIGLSIFGTTLALKLHEDGHNVVVVDVDREKVINIRDKVTEAIIADVTLAEVIHELDVNRFDTIAVCMSDDFEAAIFALTLLKQEGADSVVVQAKTHIQKHILYKLGADDVVQPACDMAERLAKRLTVPNLSDMFDFKGMSIADLKVNNDFDGKTLKQLDFRHTFNISVLLIRRPGQPPEPMTDPDLVLHKGDELTVLGKEEDIIKAFNA
ncbi:MAG: TrkA family potassium uptake protein [Victivallales bacterium]|nr:TrkA family potassium uptake protein [Victivallales bacterium]